MLQEMLVAPSLYEYVISLTTPVKVVGYGNESYFSNSYAASTISAGVKCSTNVQPLNSIVPLKFLIVPLAVIVSPTAMSFKTVGSSAVSL